MKTDDRDRCQLQVPAEPQYLPMALHLVSDIAELAGFDQRDRQRIEVAVEEAVSNVITHAYPEGGGVCGLTGVITPTGLEIRIHDTGLPFDPEQIPDFRPDPDGKTASSGLGSHLIRHLMDEMEFCNLGNGGKETRFVRYLPHASIFEGAGHPVQTDDVVVTDPGEIAIRLMDPVEAVEVARCVYDAYGYSYVYEHIYYPDRLRAMNHEGSLISAVAVTGTGDVAGHVALVFDPLDPGSAEVAIAATKCRYRGHAVVPRLVTFLEQVGREQGLTCLFSQPVTAHTISQHVFHKLGYHTSGFLLAHAPATLSFHRIAEDLAQRESVAIACKYLVSPEAVTLYPPSVHARMVGAICADIGLPATIAPGQFLDDAVRTELQSVIKTGMLVASIHFSRFGADLSMAVRHEVIRLKREGVQVIEASLDLSDPAAASAAGLLEDLGFIFTGIIPTGAGGAQLLMQYLNGIVIDYQALRLESDFSKELLEYIRLHDPQSG
ncbi:GNAT family N-acetyltransferase [Methanosphaerula palustris]|uniref:Putative anti-sigma regulatory factor, serine/threonine protein kinase n=1 Tax=Methanosphaerula palustris (strain ATCC BAA-1556 / DSM 19958 / E1-9c) TaxID=521011 RepID=B8GKT2_METPE|nr:GNAT family N-acetyltransferase [Methanosphaerula palustris]ACL17228.1 putative anti-sigma regulatory factor, serine/threonine protein kinase [Methanosphaerula palustris E1-9c]